MYPTAVTGMNTSLKYFALVFIACFALNAQSQLVNTDVDSELTARAGSLPFTPWEGSFSVVKAAGMEMLDDEDDAAAMIDDLLDFAFSFEGIRYRRGGKTPSGFDCSGYTGYVFSQFGIKLNADSRSQFLQGEAVEDIRDVQPGDLVFFGGRGAGQRIGHVGIAVEVDYDSGVVTFIHSATSGGVRTDNTADPYYSYRYKGARRVL